MTIPIATLALATALAGPPEGFKTYDAETFFDTTAVMGASFSSDGSRILVSSDRSGVFNVYAIPVDGGAPAQLTESTTDAYMAVSWFPNDDRFLYTADQGGNELSHVYVGTPGGETVDLTPGEGHLANFAGWSGDLSKFYVVSNERNPQSMDLYVYDATTYERTLLYQNDAAMMPGGISRDGSTIALAKIRNNADSDIYVWNVETPEVSPRLVTPHEGNINHQPQGFSIDGKHLYYTSNEGSEWARLWSVDLESGDRALVEEADWDIVGTSLSWSGRYRITTVNADARTEVAVVDTTTGERVVLPDLPRGDIAGLNIARSEKAIAFYVNGDTAPSNLYVLDLESGKARRLTDTLNPAIDPDHLVESEIVRYPSFDGLEIPALLYRPHAATADSPVPAIVFVHGGPGGQTRTGYSAMMQHLVNHGYAILAVNNRGSSGYGKTFFHLDDKRHGEDDLQDCIYGRRYLETLDWVDGDKVAIMGGSYGGYMVAAALAFEPEAFDVGINVFGVTNWLRTLESIPPWWADFREALYAELGDPETDRDRLHRISPLFHASNIEKPLLVVQGANDPRVLQVESDELVEAVRDNGVPVEYVLFPDEGHGFRKKVNRITAQASYLEFLERYLRGG